MPLGASWSRSSFSFFDPRDLVQVKYEMLRRLQADGQSVTQAAAAFGFSRPSSYQAQSVFEQSRLAGLVPHKRGPKEAHKLTREVVEFLQQKRQDDSSLRAPALARQTEERFGVVVLSLNHVRHPLLRYPP
jgi:transposase